MKTEGIHDIEQCLQACHQIIKFWKPPASQQQASRTPSIESSSHRVLELGGRGGSL